MSPREVSKDRLITLGRKHRVLWSRASGKAAWGSVPQEGVSAVLPFKFQDLDPKQLGRTWGEGCGLEPRSGGQLGWGEREEDGWGSRRHSQMLEDRHPAEGQMEGGCHVRGRGRGQRGRCAAWSPPEVSTPTLNDHGHMAARPRVGPDVGPARRPLGLWLWVHRTPPTQGPWMDVQSQTHSAGPVSDLILCNRFTSSEESCKDSGNSIYLATR